MYNRNPEKVIKVKCNDVFKMNIFYYRVITLYTFYVLFTFFMIDLNDCNSKYTAYNKRFIELCHYYIKKVFSSYCIIHTDTILVLGI